MTGLTGDGTCKDCGSELFLRAYLKADGNPDFALLCPNCDQIELEEPIDLNDPVDLSD